MTQTAKEAARLHRRESTGAEQLLWDALRGRRLAGLKFRRQHAVGPYILDFFCPDLKLVVEVDGPSHDEQVDYDADRTHHLEQYGYTVRRFCNERVLTDLDAVLNHIAALATHLAPTRPAPPLRNLGEGAGG